MEEKRLVITIKEASTVITYEEGSEILYSISFAYGTNNLEKFHLSVRAASLLRSATHTALEHISLYDRIPSVFVVNTQVHREWCRHVLAEDSYSQFYIKEGRPSVILGGSKRSPHTSITHARHQTATRSLKV